MENQGEFQWKLSFSVSFIVDQGDLISKTVFKADNNVQQFAEFLVFFTNENEESSQ